MAIKEAPHSNRGRGRWAALTSVFFAVLLAASATVSPAFAGEKGFDDPGHGNGNGKSAPAEVSAPVESKPGGEQGSHDDGGSRRGSGGQGASDHKSEGRPSSGGESEGSSQGNSNGTQDQGVSTPSGGAGGSQGGSGGQGNGNGNTDNGSDGQQIGEASLQTPIDKDGEPNKPPTEKYNGPCTRHEDPPGNGTGHDWHRGWGWGHGGEKVTPPDGDDGDGPGDEPGPTDEGEPPGDGNDEGPFLPFTPTQPATIVQVSSTTTERDPDLPDFLPYTGGEFDALLAVAACAALAGMALRGLAKPRLYTHRRIAR